MTLYRSVVMETMRADSRQALRYGSSTGVTAADKTPDKITSV